MNKSLQEILKVRPSGKADMPRCSSCGGWGRYLSLEEGQCDHCRREHPRPSAVDAPRAPKKRRVEWAIAPPIPRSEEKEMIAKLLEESDRTYQEVKLDSQGVRQIMKELKQKMERNILDRSKYAEDPMKFIDSETELLEQIFKLSAISTHPSLYPELLEAGLGTLFLELLQHQNSDISIELLKLLNELTDATEEDEVEGVEKDEAKRAAETDAASEGLALLIEDLQTRNFFPIMVENLSRFKEFENDDDVDGVFYTLSVVENLMEFEPELGASLCEKTALLRFLLKRLDTKNADQNKHYSSEILSILLQSNPQCAEQVRVLQVDDVPALVVLLKSISLWKRRDPKSTEDQECLENEFNCLFILLMNAELKKQFVEVEGFELMKLFIESGRYGKANAITCFDYALQGSKENSTRFMNNDLLKYLIPAFLGKNLSHPMRKKNESKKVIEHVISTLETLFCSFPSDDVNYHRLLKKFLENDLEKTNRALELFVEYWARVSQVSVQPVQLEEIDPEEQVYLAKLDAGLFSLQKLAVIVGSVCSHEAIAAHVKTKCREQNIALPTIIACVEDYYDSFDEEVAAEKRDLFAQLIIQLKAL